VVLLLHYTKFVTNYMPIQLKSFSRFFIFSLLSCVLLFSYTLPASAQESGLSMSPATIEETLDPGAQKQHTISITNLDAKEQTYYLYTRNISGVRDGGVPIFADSNLERTGYELADWITLPTNQITVPGGEKASFDFSLNVPADASCSHFGGIFFSVDPPEIENSGAAVGYQVANIISLRVTGECNEQATIRQFSTVKYLNGSQDIDFTVRIQNTGNVLVRPVGPLEVYNMLGNKVGNVTFNEERSAVFPNDEREYTDLNWTGDSVGFGRYEAILSPIYGESGAFKTMSSTVTFWILPMNIIGPALGVLAVILLIAFISVRLYIRRSLAHLNQGRRVIQRRRRGGSSEILLLTVVTLTVVGLFMIVLLALFA
jgi:hypothetical protein